MIIQPTGNNMLPDGEMFTLCAGVSIVPAEVASKRHSRGKLTARLASFRKADGRRCGMNISFSLCRNYSNQKVL
jgi:hypothetical protein